MDSWINSRRRRRAVLVMLVAISVVALNATLVLAAEGDAQTAAAPKACCTGFTAFRAGSAA